MTLAARARALALRAHGGQRYGDRPYSQHLDAVVEVARRHGMSATAIAAAYLHDTVEDCEGITVDMVAAETNQEVARLVAALTKPPRGTPERLDRYLEQIRSAGAEAVGLKLADRIANVRACVDEQPDERLLSKYRGEQEDGFRRVLYRVGEWDAAWAELEQLLR